MTDEFRQEVNRFNKVPAINDNGFKLTESVAIFHYLGRKGTIPERFYPRNDIKKLTRIDEYLEWHHNGLFASAGQLFYFNRPDLPPPSEDVNERLKKSLIGTLDVLENRWLEDSKFLAGDEVSYADLVAAVMFEQIIGTRLFKLDDTKYPKISKWLEEVKKVFGKDYADAHQFVYKYGERYGPKV